MVQVLQVGGQVGARVYLKVKILLKLRPLQCTVIILRPCLWTCWGAWMIYVMAFKSVSGYKPFLPGSG